MPNTRSYDAFRQTRFFASLDGIRAISVLLVILWHMPEKEVWGGLHGWLGVSMFFVLSGFLITTLCLREGALFDGKFDLGAFYVRRVHRILPLYFCTVALYAVLTSFNFIRPWSEFVSNLGYYLTVSMDLAINHEPFRHAWSLGIEEKFYFLWPLALLGVLRLPSRWRIGVTAGLAVIAFGAPSSYVRLYLPITLGCLLAFVLDDEQLRRKAKSIATAGHGLVLGFSIAVSIAVQLAVNQIPAGAKLYAFAVTAMIGMLLLRPSGAISQGLATRAARWIGKRSYGIYLLHPVIIHIVDQIAAPSSSEVLTIAVRLLLVVAASFLVADIAHRYIETPLIARGHRIARRRAQRRGLPQEIVRAEAQRAVPAEQ